jgi:hypothetical protein
LKLLYSNEVNEMNKLTIIYTALSMFFLFGCTGCFTKDVMTVKRSPEAHKNLVMNQRSGFKEHRLITLHWGDRSTKEELREFIK